MTGEPAVVLCVTIVFLRGHRFPFGTEHVPDRIASHLPHSFASGIQDMKRKGDTAVMMIFLPYGTYDCCSIALTGM
jgi:hypothetical protein